MISCTEFIPAYSELFKYIEVREGHAGVEAYWKYISDTSIQGALGECIRREGVKGCYTYWSRTLNEEAADFTLTFDERAGKFSLDMHHCPSKGMLLELGYMDPYYDYCGHCDLLYRRVCEAEGLKYTYDMSGIGEARCGLAVSGAPKPDSDAAPLIMDRRTADNKYLHRDFHAILDGGLKYIGKRYGDEAVEEYLRAYARAFYAPLAAKARAEGLRPIADYIRGIYEAEEASDELETELSDDKLVVRVEHCPAIEHMRKLGCEPSGYQMVLAHVVYDELAKMAGLTYGMDYYSHGWWACWFERSGARG